MNLTEHIALDSASVRHKDANGYLHIDSSHISKEQVAGYYGAEIGPVEGADIKPDVIYYGYRPGAELERAAGTFNGIPVLFEHHDEGAENPCKEFRVGSTGTDAAYNAPYLDNSLHITDSVAIAAIESGEYRELSCAYGFVMDWTEGEFNGQKYDFVMRDIQGNHVALVNEGRAGHDVRVADAAPNTTQGEGPDEKGESAMDKIKELLKQALAEVEGGCTDTGAAETPPPPVEAVKGDTDAGNVAEPAEAVQPEVDSAANEELENMLAAIGNEELANGIRAYINSLKAGMQDTAEAPAAGDGDTATEACGTEGVKDTTETPPPEAAKDAKDAKANDAAILARQAAEVAEKRVKESMKAKYTAAQDCAPLVGVIVNPFEYETAEDIYKIALDAKGVDTARHPKTAYKSMVAMLKDTEAPSAVVGFAADSVDDEGGTKFENLKNIRRA